VHCTQTMQPAQLIPIQTVHHQLQALGTAGMQCDAPHGPPTVALHSTHRLLTMLLLGHCQSRHTQMARLETDARDTAMRSHGI
jgi:hypothetical protein